MNRLLYAARFHAALWALPALTLSACGFETTRSEHAVTLADAGHARPSVLRVRVGDTVVWHNEGLRPRVVLFDSDLARNLPRERLPAGAPETDVPPGAEAWRSGSLYQGETYSRVFTEPGTYVYVPAFVAQAGPLLDASDVNLSETDLPPVGAVLVTLHAEETGAVEADEEESGAEEPTEQPTGQPAEEAPTEDEAMQEEAPPEEAAGQDEGTGFAVSGAQVYQVNCATCHGSQGQGGIGPALAGNDALQDTGAVVRQILRGGGGMPAFAEQLNDEQIAAIATYIRTTWGNDFGRVSVDRVQDLREQTQGD